MPTSRSPASPPATAAKGGARRWVDPADRPRGASAAPPADRAARTTRLRPGLVPLASRPPGRRSPRPHRRPGPSPARRESPGPNRASTGRSCVRADRSSAAFRADRRRVGARATALATSRAHRPTAPRHPHRPRRRTLGPPHSRLLARAPCRVRSLAHRLRPPPHLGTNRPLASHHRRPQRDPHLYIVSVAVVLGSPLRVCW